MVGRGTEEAIGFLPAGVCGIDEVGRGALAGPLVAAAVVLDGGFAHPLLRDSKRLSEAQRERVEPAIRAAARAVEVVSVGPALIDRHGVGWANRTAIEQLLQMVVAPLFLVDGNLVLRTELPYRSIVRGDSRVPAIAAASIVAKVHRDRLMRSLDLSHPGYGWSGNKGYGSSAHLAAVARLGPTPQHRLSFLHSHPALPF